MITYPIVDSIDSPLLAVIKALIEAGYSPGSLFSQGQGGAMYFFQPTFEGATSIFQDSAGTVPADTDGDPIMYVLDHSGNGLHAIQPSGTAGLTLRTDGTSWWAEADATQNRPVIPAAALSGDTRTIIFGYTETGLDNSILLGAVGDSNSFLFVSLDGSTNTTINSNASYTGLRGNSNVIDPIPTNRNGNWDVVTMNEVLTFTGVSLSGSFLTEGTNLLGYAASGWEAEGNITAFISLEATLTESELLDIESFIAGLL